MMRGSLLAIAALLAALNACSGGGGGGGSIPPFDVPAGVVVANFDQDRLIVALAFAHVAGPPPHPGYVRVFRQSAPGMFDAPMDYAVGPDPYGLSAGDFDGDGLLDLVAASPGAAAQPNPADIGISILRQDPAAPGRFLSAQWVTTPGAAATDAAIAEHKNGLADVVVSDGRSANGQALLLAQNPARPGELFPPVSLLVGSGHGSEDIAVGDVNGDGLIDVVLAAQDVVALFYQQQPGGVFAPVVTLTAGLRVSGVALADLDGDGSMDIVVANAGNAPAGGTGGASVTILLQTAPGNFVATSIPVADGARRVTIADLDGDKFPDIAVVSIVFQALDRPSRVTVLLQSATSRGQFSVGQVLDGPSSGNFIAIGDLDGDGRNDILVNDGPSVLFQRALGTFSPLAPLR